ncbi:hypothetical protein H9Q72_011372 [Fusarium xylarioides]|uniref:Uncharacterized protein n=1 Tax=Fusarium xylarioides TaxID=221167 RepID=A0A9P7HNX8_9HYPO|nr:hypothetical protein H9Q72_011372 [Fusarium xylarioides]
MQRHEMSRWTLRKSPRTAIRLFCGKTTVNPLPCDDLEIKDNQQGVPLAANDLSGNEEGHSKTEQIRDASESNTIELSHQEMTQFESEANLFDSSDNSDAGPEEMDATEEQTGTIERQDQRSPPPIHDIEEESATQQIKRHSGATERQDQQSRQK